MANLFLGEEQKKNLESELTMLKEKLAPTESAVIEAANKLKKLQVPTYLYLKIKLQEDGLLLPCS